jgi:CRISPR system Cascade subunit CasE
MYISKLILNDRDRKVRHDLSNIHNLHRSITHAFPDVEPLPEEEQKRIRADWQILFRLEPDSNILLVQSELEPDWGKLPPSYFRPQPKHPGYEHKPFQPEPSQFPVDRLLRFRLKANPSKRDKETRKTVGLYSQADQEAWFRRQAAQHGFSVEGVDIIPAANLWGEKAKGQPQIKIHTALFQGVLKVQDPALLVTAIQQGIGRGKSYGCGLLSLQRLDLPHPM